jgi:hypothetical protein
VKRKKMKHKMNEHEMLDVIGNIVMTGGALAMILAILFQFVRALLHG